jgi:hypothetical protein
MRFLLDTWRRWWARPVLTRMTPDEFLGRRS